MTRAVRFEARSAWDWLVWALRGILATAVVAATVAGSSFGATPAWIAASSGAGGLLAAFAVSALPSRDEAAARFVESVVLVLFVAHMMGHVLRLYDEAALFDDGLHFAGGLLGGLAGVAALCAWFPSRVTRSLAVLAALSVPAVLGVGLELFEFSSDAFFGLREQTDPRETPLVDTMRDLTASSAASVVAAVAGALAVRDGRVRKPAEVLTLRA